MSRDKRSVSLDDVPRDAYELEDFVAALFLSAGFYVEKNVVEHDVTSILEVDVVATSYDDQVPQSILAEAKSGRWGFADMFKVIGWMRHMDVDTGAFIATEARPDYPLDFIRGKMGRLGLHFALLTSSGEAATSFREAGLPEPTDDIALEIWRFSFWIERELIAALREAAKSDDGLEGAREARDYYRLINNGIFFENDVRLRPDMLYEAYQAHPRLSLAVAREIEGEPFDATAKGASKAYRRALIYGRYPTVQAALYLEHRARLAILKAAIDYVCLSQAGLLEPVEEGPMSKGDFLFALLPESFHEALKELSTCPSFRRYALFWQVFLWAFGGFYLRDREEQEFRLLSEQTGVPVDEIPTALEAFDRLFPAEGGWFRQPEDSECRLVFGVPIPFRGIGAHQRRRRYGVTEFDELGYEGLTCIQLHGWIDNTVDFLA